MRRGRIGERKSDKGARWEIPVAVGSRKSAAFENREGRGSLSRDRARIKRTKVGQPLERAAGYSNGSKAHGVTVKVVALVAAPPAVVIAILPVFAPVGTVAVTCVSELAVNVVAFTPPNVTD